MSTYVLFHVTIQIKLLYIHGGVIIKNIDYIPVFRGHTAELSVLKNYDFPDNFVPLVECVTAYAGRKKELKNFKSYYVDKLSHLKNVMIEIPQGLSYVHKLQGAQKMLFEAMQESLYAQVEYLNEFKDYHNIIPCLSLNVEADYEEDEVSNLINKLQSKRKAIRIHPGKYSNHNLNLLNNLCQFVKRHATNQDIVIFDIGGTKISTTRGNRLIESVLEHIAPYFDTYLFHHSIQAIPIGLLPDNKLSSKPDLIKHVNFEVIEKHKEYGFKGFSDLAGLMPYARHVLANLDAYPSYLPVCTNLKGYWGFKGEKEDLDTYKSIVYHNYIQSEHYTQLSDGHIEKCPGCKSIQKMKNGTVPIKSAPWKKIMINHYLTVVEEFLEKQDY